MSHTTICTCCGSLYEETSEEWANSPERLCMSCFRERTRAVTGRVDTSQWPRFRVTDGEAVLDPALKAECEGHARSLIVWQYGCEVGSRAQFTKVERETA